MATSTPRIRVAIVGGGIAGVTMIQALLKTNNVDAHLFEAAPAFRESGMGIGIAQNGITALELLGLKQRLLDAKGVPTPAAKIHIAKGEDTGKLGVNVDMSGNKSWGVQRSRFLTELLKDVDASRLHTGKKLRDFTKPSPDDQDQEIVLQFEDGTTHTCDVLLGADGIHSTIRKYIVGETHPSASPSYAGWQTLWINVSYADALQYLGPELINKSDTSQIAWCGKNTWIMHSLSFDEELATCIFTRRFDENNPEWARTTNKTELEGWARDFDHPVAKAMVELITKDKTDGIPQLIMQHHKPQAPNYTRGRIAIVGDAADACTPWRGSAGSMSIEDALIISSCFAEVRTARDAAAALRAYETLQLPRRSRLVRESYHAGLIMCGLDEDVGLDAGKMKQALGDSWSWIHDVDLSERVREAMDVMRAEIGM